MRIVFLTHRQFLIFCLTRKPISYLKNSSNQCFCFKVWFIPLRLMLKIWGDRNLPLTHPVECLKINEFMDSMDHFGPPLNHNIGYDGRDLRRENIDT